MARKTALVLALACFAADVFAGPKFKNTWKPPDAVPTSFKGQKVAAVVMMKDVRQRNGVEDELAIELRSRGIVGIAAHTLLPTDEDIADKDQVRAHFEQQGVVGAVVLRSVEKQTEITDSGPTYWVTNTFTFSGYYGYGWVGIYDPGHATMDSYFTVETLIYDVKADKLLWAGVTQTKNPKRVDEFMHDLANAVAEQLKKEGLVKK